MARLAPASPILWAQPEMTPITLEPSSVPGQASFLGRSRAFSNEQRIFDAALVLKQAGKAASAFSSFTTRRSSTCSPDPVSPFPFGKSGMGGSSGLVCAK